MHLGLCSLRRAGAVLCAGLALACGGTPGSLPRSLVVVTFDTTRADRLGCYGHPLPTSPHIDALAARGVLFERAYAPMPQTLPSHATLFTGLGPRDHGALHNFYVLGGQVRTLAELLAARGYATAAVVGARVLSPDTGIDRGFAHYALPPPGESARHADAVTDAALAWADAHEGGPYLLWVHYWDPHEPYVPPERALSAIPEAPVRAAVAARADELLVWGASLEEVAAAQRAYDAEIRFADEELGRLLRGLDERGLLANAVVAMTADHGQGLLEHGRWGHGVQLYDEAVRVPLVVATPDGEAAGRRVRAPVGLEAVAPTLYRLATGETSDELPSADLFAWVRSDPPPAPAPIFLERPHFSRQSLDARQARIPGPHVEWGVYTGVVADGHKLVQAPGGALELYDLHADPEELRDRSAEDPETAKRLRRQLAGWRIAHPTTPPGLGPPLAEDRRAWLERLGYIVK